MRAFFISLLTLFAACASAIAACENVPIEVQEYLRSEPDWSFVDVKDLVADDRSLWKRAHDGHCPGIAIVDLDGMGQSYALALLRASGRQTIEKLVVVRRQSGRLTGQVLDPPMRVKHEDAAAPFVVWRAGPDTYRDLMSGRQVTLAHEGIVYEKMEAMATMYYFSNGGFGSISTSE
jgi:hypothetical protein